MSNRPIRILLIEDNPGDARLMQVTLTEARRGPFELECVERLSAGLDRLAKGGIDIVLLDLTLPDGHGLGTLTRAREHAPGVPIVVLTVDDDDVLAVKAVQEGAQDYLVKGKVDGDLLARTLRYAIERKRAEEKIRRHHEHQAVLHDINVAITATLDLSTILDILMEKIALLLPYSAIEVWLLSKETGRLEAIACRNLNEEEWKTEEWKAQCGIHKVVSETKAPVLIGNVQTDPRLSDHDFFRKHGLVSYLGVPLVTKGEFLGVLSFYTRKEHWFSDEEVGYLSTLAGQAAMAIHNSQLYEQTKNQAVELDRANRVKAEFLGIMSHEFRTPLNVVVGYVAMMQDEKFGEINQKQEKALKNVAAHTKDLSTMINDILVATKIEAEPLKVEWDEVRLGEFLDELKSAYDVALDRELAITWDYPSDLPVMKSDSAKLKKILQNLINNAIKFTERGQVGISARYLPGREIVEFKVADTGIGIPKDALPIIFDKFRQLDGSETRSYGGVGLGLHIVKAFTELLRGAVHVESEPEKGSTFTVSFPLVCKDGGRSNGTPAAEDHWDRTPEMDTVH